MSEPRYLSRQLELKPPANLCAELQRKGHVSHRTQAGDRVRMERMPSWVCRENAADVPQERREERGTENGSLSPSLLHARF